MASTAPATRLDLHADAVLLVCRACGSQTLITPPSAGVWATAHRMPVLLAVRVTAADGSPDWWRRG